MNFFKKIVQVGVLAVLLVTIFLPNLVSAAVGVKGYYRKDGTYVQPHYRSNPDGNPYNNWSYPGNTNPYTGETAKGNPETYLDNYYGSGGYVSGSIDNTYKAIEGGYKSYGITSCYSGYYNKGGECKKVPENGYSLYDTFSCNYGYQKYSDSCVKVPSNSYYNGNTWVCNNGYYKSGDYCAATPLNSSANGISWWCNAGYTQYGDSCVKSIENAHIKYDKWECDAGFYFNNDGKCINIDQICKDQFGFSAYGVGGSCYCKDGYDWISIGGIKSCTVNQFEVSSAKSYSTASSASVFDNQKNKIDTSNSVQKYSFTSDISIGMKGSGVVQLQNFLEENGFLVIPANSTKGYFGRLTSEALKKYQMNNGLEVTGYLDSTTRASINIYKKV